MSLGMVSYDGKREFYAEFTDYDSSQIDEWLEENVLENFILSEMEDRSYLEKEKTRFLRGDVDWVVSHPKGLREWLQSFGEKIICASCGNTYDWVLFRSLLGVKYKEDLPDYLDGWAMDVISLFRWEGHTPGGEDFKEDFLEMRDRSSKHNALVDAHVARELYLKLEANRRLSN
ncbi:MAG: hypothetical protein CL914_08210 [Deltaproteobacteria bacterium]|nr:hypothetical protein [Deltaproteobacteria bacterium]MBI11915.1 hypothetical protein [Deltaproteobacteria bacterium]